MTRHIARRGQHGRWATACVAATLLLTACGTGSDTAASEIASLAADGGIEQPAPTDVDVAPAPDDSAPDDDGERTEEELAADQDKAFEDYNACLEEIGVNPDDFIVFGDESGDGAAIESDSAPVDATSDEPLGLDVTSEQLERMQDECEPLLAAIDNGFDLSPEQQAELSDLELTFAQCMRENGVPDFADPGAGDQDGTFELPQDADFEVIEEAFATCDDVFDGSDVFGDTAGDEG